MSKIVIDLRGVLIPNDDKEIYDWFGMENTTPNDIKLGLKEAAGKPVCLKVNSPGGSLTAGSEIYTELSLYKGELESLVLSQASSAASLAIMSRKCIMSPTALMMIHNVQSGVRGDHIAMEKTAEVLKTADKTVAAAYIKKSGMSEEEVLELMSNETYLTAEQALQKGLIDGILDTSNQYRFTASNGALLPCEVLEKLRLEFANKKEKKQQAVARMKYLSLGGIVNE